jgi:hypothetical protein
MGQRGDTTLLFEPFTSVYFLGTDRESPRHKDIPVDISYTYANLWDQLTNKSNVRGSTSRDIIFAKDFATSFPRWRWDSFPMDKVEHAFLIRNPREA